ncbi:MAG: hypothetical protein KF787_09200 [Phycisphaeraceae bacterium]|nr:hypothetical protein [Phycisphaerae bacterium]MBX3392810.1 hypothetical protein [Phycisphaeraceae bacterium]HRJ50940.1 hypothetical protein [Phycisphaerales bacterium]
MKTDPTDLECPTCSFQTGTTHVPVRIDYGRWPAWFCPTCGGMALGRDLADQVIGGFDDDEVEDVTREPSVSCARCDTPRRSLLVRGRAVVDRCPSCGLLWIEGDEVSAMVASASGPEGTRGMEAWFKDAILAELGPLRMLTGFGQPTESEIFVKILRALIGGP